MKWKRRKAPRPELRVTPPPGLPVRGAYAMVAGRRFDIRTASLHGGQFHFTAYRNGPSEAITGHVTIFGSDGKGICQAPGEFHVPAAPKGSIIEYDIHLRMTKMEAA